MRHIIQYFVIISCLAMILGCESKINQVTGNPPAEGFNAAESDPKALAIADEVMQAMGGRQAWDNTRYLKWNFFGARDLVWDKQTGDVRIEVPKDDLIYLVNIHSMEGQVKRGEETLSNPDTLRTFLEKGKNIWINDAYWLVMPFKLKDSGVTLKYVKAGQTSDGKAADILELTFNEVGHTPDNKYWVYVDQESRLVTQWDFFTKASDTEPRFSTPWANYKSYGDILLSGDRGQRKLNQIAVPEQLPRSVFTSLVSTN